MPVEPFSLSDAERVLAHPDTPAAYSEWVEILPLTGTEDRTHLGNLLAWSHRAARQPLGAARATFARALGDIDDDLLDEWMAALARTPVVDFLDHHVPFLRNVHGEADKGLLLREFMDAYRRPEPPAVQPLPGRRLWREAPDSVILEITRSCNFACTMCSSRTGGYLPERTMPLPVFGELVRVLGAGASTLRINGYGETTLVPDLPRYLDCLDEFGFNGVREIVTNLSAPIDVYADLFARGFVLLVSWDSVSPAAFERIRVGSRYDDLSATLRVLGGLARCAPERLGLLCTIQEANLAEAAALVKLARDVGAGLVIFNMVKEANGSPWMDTRFEEIRDRFAEADELAGRHGILLRLPDHVGRRRLRLRQTHRSSATFCDRPWRELLVRWDTELTVCNMFNPFSYGVLCPPGPARDVPARFRRLWTGPNAALFRRMINSDASHGYCRECYFLYP